MKKIIFFFVIFFLCCEQNIASAEEPLHDISMNRSQEVKGPDVFDFLGWYESEGIEKAVLKIKQDREEQTVLFFQRLLITLSTAGILWDYFEGPMDDDNSQAKDDRKYEILNKIFPGNRPLQEKFLTGLINKTILNREYIFEDKNRLAPARNIQKGRIHNFPLIPVPETLQALIRTHFVNVDYKIIISNLNNYLNDPLVIQALRSIDYRFWKNTTSIDSLESLVQSGVRTVDLDAARLIKKLLFHTNGDLRQQLIVFLRSYNLDVLP